MFITPALAAEEAAHGKTAHAFPPFDPATYPSTIFWLAITFFAFYWLVKTVLLPQINGILETRSATISGDLAEARRLKDETDAAIAGYESALAEARKNANEIAAKTRADLAAKVEARRSEAESRIGATTAEAEARIADLRARGFAQVNGIATDVAHALVERIAGAAPPREEVAGAVARTARS